MMPLAAISMRATSYRECVNFQETSVSFTKAISKQKLQCHTDTIVALHWIAYLVLGTGTPQLMRLLQARQ